MVRAARDTLKTVTVMLPDDLLKRIAREMRREPRWGFGNRSRAVRVLLDEALTAREERRLRRGGVAALSGELDQDGGQQT